MTTNFFLPEEGFSLILCGYCPYVQNKYVPCHACIPQLFKGGGTTERQWLLGMLFSIGPYKKSSMDGPV